MKRIRLGNLPAQVEAHRAVTAETPPVSFFVPFALIDEAPKKMASRQGTVFI